MKRSRTKSVAVVRLATGLVLATFVTAHLANHALGVISVDAQEALRRVLSPIWRSAPGTLLLYGALIVHAGLGLHALWRRRTLRMPLWEFAQLALGLAIPLLLFPHVFGTRVAVALADATTSYPTVIASIWSSSTNLVRQPLLVLVVWGHLMVGLHYWLRLRAGYRRALPLLAALALALPLLALLGFWGAALELRARGELAAAPVAAPAYGDGSASPAGYGDPPGRSAGSARVEAAKTAAQYGYSALLALVLVARLGRQRLAARRGVYRIEHSGGRRIVATVGQSVLEALRDARVPHASVCGGRARCTTCRIRVRHTAGSLPEPAALETQALERIHAPPDVRLACQLRPAVDIRVTPLLPPHLGSADVAQARVSGRERAVAVMFVDLRESSRLGEQRLPYDVFFILNRFFAEMADALRETRGLYSTFNGDGFMALYGMTSDIERGCRDAMRGAIAIGERLERINAALAADLRQPLRIGVGIHAGEAIVGSMGPPEHPVLSALGDTVNVAARLEGETKSHDCMLVISAAAARSANVELSGFPMHTATVRGRGAAVDYHAVDDLQALRRAIEAADRTVPAR